MNNRPEPLSIDELTEMQALQIKRFLLDSEDEAYTRKLAAAHGVDPDGFGKTWTLRGLALVHLTNEITGQEIAQNASA